MAVHAGNSSYELRNYALRQSELRLARQTNLNVPVDGGNMVQYVQEKLGFQPNDIAQGVVNRAALRLQGYFVRNPSAIPNYVTALVAETEAKVAGQPSDRPTVIPSRIAATRTPQSAQKVAHAMKMEAVAKVAVEAEAIRALMEPIEVRFALRSVEEAVFTDSRSAEYADRPRTKVAISKVESALDGEGNDQTLIVLNEQITQIPPYSHYRNYEEGISSAQARLQDAREELVYTIEIVQPFIGPELSADGLSGRSIL